MTTNLFAQGVAKAWEYYSKDVGKSLIHWGSVGWVFSSLAQIFAIAINKDIEKKEKKFLIPQEMADGAVNVGLYYTITQAIKSLGDSIVESGNFIKKDTADFLEVLNTKKLKLKDFVKNFGSISEIINKLKNTKSFPDVDANTLNTVLSGIDRTTDSFSHWKNGVGTVFTIAASVLACNVITPYCRNKIASNFQKHHIAKTAFNDSQKNTTNNIYRPVSNTFSAFKI